MSFVSPRAAAPRTDETGDPGPSGSSAGSDEAFRALFRGHLGHVWRSLRALGVHEADVADASQQVFLVLNANLARWNRVASPRALVYGICLRVASDYRRRAHRRYERLFASPPDVASGGPSPEDQVDRRRELVRLDAALNELPPLQREVFVLFEMEELDMSEVAQAVGCPLFTAYSRLRAARKAIAARLGASAR
jgi:RNA polymerase sigma-70 factor (ECF subfamily)